MEEVIRELVRVGVVTNVYPDRGTVRVRLTDADDQVSFELPVIFRKTMKDKEYWMPDVGEQVVCLFSAQGLEQGFVLGAIYSKNDSVPVASRDKWHIRFEDGTTIEYDKKEHKCSVDCKGQIFVKSATNITIQAPSINMKGGSPADGCFEGNFRLIGDLKVQGNIHATGSIIDDSGNTNHHSH